MTEDRGMNRFWRVMGGPISRWFCTIHLHEFLIFRHGAGAHHAAVCLKCRRGEQ